MFPRQRLSYQDKIKNDNEWGKKNVKYIIETATPILSEDRQRMLRNYRLFNNILDQKDFERECNPYGIQVGQIADEVKPYNKTYNKIQVLLGDELARPFNFKAVLSDSEGIRSKLAHRDMLLRQYVLSQVQSTLQSIGANFEPEELQGVSETIMHPSDIEAYMKTTYMDSKEIMANKLLSFLKNYLSIPVLRNEAFKHALIAAKEIIYVSHLHGMPYLEVINPFNFFCHASPDTRYIEDSLYAGHEQEMTSAEVLDFYGEDLSEDDLNKIEAYPFPSSSYSEDQRTMNYNRPTHDPYLNAHPTNLTVYTVEWVSQKKVGFLTYVNEFGDTVTDIVSEDFVVPDNAQTYVETKEYGRKCKYYYWTAPDGSPYKIRFEFIPEVWTGTRIGQDIYCKIGPKTHQFRSNENPYDVKLSYHGSFYNNTNADPVSIMDRMWPFQFLYLVIMHKMKKLIAQDQGKVIKIDTSTIDPTVGWEKTMYFIKEMGLEFYNPLQNAESPGAGQRGNITHTLDVSNTQQIMGYISILNALDTQISDVAGVNRQREGQISSTEAVSNAQSNVQMSSLLTEIYFFEHDQIWARVLSSTLQLAQSLFKSKPALLQWVLDDLSVASLQMSPSDISNADFALFVTSSQRETKLFNAMEMIADRLLQANRAKFSDIIKMYKSTSSAELEAKILASEAQALQEEQAKMKQEQDAAFQLQQQQQEFALENQQREFEHDILLHQIDSFRFQKDQDLDNNQVPDQLEIAKFVTDTALQSRKLDLQELQIKKRAMEAAKKSEKN